MEIFIAISIFALFDFFGYNISKRKGWVNEKFINPYRIAQATVQVGITLYLLLQYDLISALSFNILWWTWCADWIFYLYCIPFGWIFDLSGGWKTPFKNIVRWAWWTPYGLAEILGEKEIIAWQYLMLQSIIGILITIIINSL